MHAFLRSVVFSLIALPTLISAAWAGTVKGRVVDPDARAVGGATVLLVDRGAILATTETDAAGVFTLTTPHDGPFDVHVSVEGFRARPISVRADGDAGTIRLEVSAVREAVVVSAAQVDIPLSTTSSSVTVLTGNDLAALQVHGLADALRLVPGLTVTAAGATGAQTSVFPRGGESDYSLVFIDGVQANAFGGGFDFAHVPTNNVDRIEIVRGPQSALYGSNAIGSVIRIVTKRGGPPTASALVEGGRFGTSRLAGAASGEARAWRWGASAERLASDGVVQNDDYERWNISSGVGLSQQTRTLRGDVHYTADERGFPGPYGSDPGGTFAGIDTVSRGSNDRWLASISGSLQARPRLRVNGQLAHSRIDGRQTSSFDPEHPSTIASRRSLGRLQADIVLLPSLQASAGGELQRERGESTFITASNSQEVPVRRTLAGLFAEARWSRENRLFLTGGIRAERIARHRLSGNSSAFAPRPDFADDVVVSVNPKIGAAWFVRSSGETFTKLHAAAGTGIRPPDAFEIAFTDNPSLKPERTRSVEGGIDHTLAGGRASLEATAFYNRYEDLIVAVGSFQRSSRYRTDNISNARARGLELSGTARSRFNWQVPVDVHLRISLTLLDTEILAVDGASAAPPPFQPGDRLLRRPAQMFSAELTARAGRTSAFLIVGGRSRTRDVDPSFGTFGGLFDAPGFAVIHAGGAWRAARNLEVFGRVTNLLDRHYEEALGFPALGRSGIVGVRVAAGR